MTRATPRAHREAGGEPRNAQSHAQTVQRWGKLREMLIAQLDMFENRGLTLYSNNADISATAIADLKTSILEFDALITRA